MAKKRRWLKIFIGIIGSVLILVGAGMGYLKWRTYPPSQKAQNLSQTSQETSTYYLFETPKKSDLNLIFYPGALVDPASYSLWGTQVAEAGVNVYLAKMPFNMAFFGSNRAAEIIAKAPEETYVLAGHSLGGVMASRFAATHDEVAGMVFLASYPDQKGDLSQTKLPVLSLSGSRDGLVQAQDITDTKQYLPDTTTFEVIEGGNHAGFGSYGEQKKDGLATISNATQQAEISKGIISWLRRENLLP